MSAERDKSDKEDQAFNLGCGALIIVIILGLGIYFDSLIAQIFGVLILCAGILNFIANKTNSDILEKISLVPDMFAVLTKNDRHGRLFVTMFYMEYPSSPRIIGARRAVKRPFSVSPIDENAPKRSLRSIAAEVPTACAAVPIDKPPAMGE